MPRTVSLQLSPKQAADSKIYVPIAARLAGVSDTRVALARVVKRSVDARRSPKVNLSLELYIDNERQPEPVHFDYPDVAGRTPVVIVGSGPAGLFCALRLIELGLRPIVLERGKDVAERGKDIALINRGGGVNPDSNYAFGEGGAGTFSDGKLFTRSKKRGDYNRALQTLVFHGASPEILYEAHPHIGTDRLPRIMTAIRETIRRSGGEVVFGARVVDVEIRGGRAAGVWVAESESLPPRLAGTPRLILPPRQPERLPPHLPPSAARHFQLARSLRSEGLRPLLCKEGNWEFPHAHGTLVEGAAVVLAAGHSARDIYEILHRRGVALEAKPFAMGVRIEHPQALIDRIQYHTPEGRGGEPEGRGEYLPAATYSLVSQEGGRGVYSFCMCPGGFIVPAMTAGDESVVNGMSPSLRNSPYANSGIVTEVRLSDFEHLRGEFGELAGLEFQRRLERVAREQAVLAAGKYSSGLLRRSAPRNDALRDDASRNDGEALRHCEPAGRGNPATRALAPAQRVADFVSARGSGTLPQTSYLPGIVPSRLDEWLPGFISEALRAGISTFGRRMRGFVTNEAVVVGVESRTSTPVRIPRDAGTLAHPAVEGLYPAGEGAGYAGGIISAALDGERIAERIGAKRG